MSFFVKDYLYLPRGVINQWIQQAQVHKGRNKDYGNLGYMDGHEITDSVNTSGLFPGNVNGIV